MAIKEFVGAELLLLSKVIKQDSIAFAFGGRNPMWLGWWLKVLGKEVHVNDILHFSYWDSVGMVENDQDTFDEERLLNLTEGFEKRSELKNPELARLVPRADAYFFDQLRERIDELPPHLKGMAIRAGYLTIRYVQTLDTSATFTEIRQPLAMVFHNLVRNLNERVTDKGVGHAYRQEANEFVKEPKADALFFQLPLAEGINLESFKGERVLGPVGREVWTAGPAKTWLPKLREQTEGTFGDKLITRESYDRALSNLLQNANDYPVWIFNLQESEYLRVLSVVRQFRKPKGVHRFDARGTTGGYVNLFLIA